MSEAERWRRCSACKNDIALGAVYWVCSVSTCNRKRTGLVFCTVDCWEIHLPTERHREAWAVEERAPRTAEPAEAPTSASRTKPGNAAGSPRPASPASRDGSGPATDQRGAGGPTHRAREGEILVVASRLKAYVKSVSGFNTSDRVLPVLSAALRALCDEAIENARRAERQTVLDRDVGGDASSGGRSGTRPSRPAAPGEKRARSTIIRRRPSG